MNESSCMHAIRTNMQAIESSYKYSCTIIIVRTSIQAESLCKQSNKHASNRIIMQV